MDRHSASKQTQTDLLVLLDHVGKLVEQHAALVAAERRVLALVESLSGGSNGSINLPLAAVRDLADLLLGGRVEGFEGVAAGDPLVVDERGGLADRHIGHGREGS